MEVIKTGIYNAYCYAYYLLYGEDQKEYECNPQEADIKLKSSLLTILNQIEVKKDRANDRLNQIKTDFSVSIHSQGYQEKQRQEYSRHLMNAQQQLDILIAIQQQLKKVQLWQFQLVANRKDKQFLQNCLPTIENLVFAAQFESSLMIKLNTFTDFLQYLWGKEYILLDENNLVEPEFKAILTKIPTQEDQEMICSRFCQDSLILPQAMYRCKEENNQTDNSTISQINPN